MSVSFLLHVSLCAGVEARCRHARLTSSASCTYSCCVRDAIQTRTSPFRTHAFLVSHTSQHALLAGGVRFNVALPAHSLFSVRCLLSAAGIDLPMYTSEDILYSRLTYAIENCSSIDADSSLQHSSNRHAADNDDDDDEWGFQ